MSNYEETDGATNMTVINEEYDRVLGNPDGMIVSDSLMGLLPAEMLSEEISPLADSHQLTVVATSEAGEDYTAAANGSLHSISSISGEMSVAITVRGDYRILLQVLNDAETSSGVEVEKIRLVGDNGFEAFEIAISSWSLIKTKSHDFLLTINFRGSNVVF